MNFDSPTPIGRSVPKREARPSQKKDVALPLPENDNEEVSGVRRRPDLQEEEELTFSDEKIDAAIAESEASSKAKRPPPIPSEALRAKTTKSSPQYHGRLKMVPPPVTEDVKNSSLRNASSLRNRMSSKDMKDVHDSLNRFKEDSEDSLADLEAIHRQSYLKEAARSLLDPVMAEVELVVSKRKGPVRLEKIAKEPSDKMSAGEAQDALASLDRFNFKAKTQDEADLGTLRSLYEKLKKFKF